MVINPNALGLDLPPGTMRVQPSLWYADEPATPDTWARLLPAREAAGMQPLLLTETQYFHPSQVADPDDHDPAATLADLWDELAQEEDAGTLTPFSATWPGLAPASDGATDPDATAARITTELLHDDDWLKGARGALVPARRSADIPAVLGWSGATAHTDAVHLSTVLRSWEDRFGIRVVGLGADLLTVSVAAPPRTIADALAVAAEHYAFCPDNIWDGYDTLRAYAAEEVLDRQDWTFWWD
ncbi:hypothetical protein AMK26_06715 [Streptomyces sp. CB03234]|uniref:DUF4253 domain-containing protein n=1 Tax=Streptomyces sp. (strain CB03234) TaxID=1703937 RepID=UPI00093C7976|nr:DUF4253 domain-containing protein [Streptomyces sp. CB03234]OKK05808.1 hypothetical protein AMK26_06715 [Streptomyces sp. CB03234]